MATGNKKHGRNKASCQRYRNEDRRAKAKKRNIARHERMYPRTNMMPARDRRAMGKAWKIEEQRRIDEAAKVRADHIRKMVGL